MAIQSFSDGVRSLIEKKEFRRARDLAANILKQDPNNNNKRFLLAVCEFQIGNYKGALNIFFKVLSTDPS
ncbi:MAG: tetratricopeptide repeat protein, partial [Bacteroidota bacterium]|nr:tetratricopeptide repeat protein [Bacteroidota bacterium]